MKPILAIIVLVIAASSAVFGQTKSNEANADSMAAQAVLQTESECDNALIRGDIAKLEQLVSDDATRTTPFGNMTNKVQWIEEIKGGRVKYISLEREDVKVRIYGNTAVVTGIVNIKWHSNGRDNESKNRYLRVYVKQQERWQFVAHQATRIGQ